MLTMRRLDYLKDARGMVPECLTLTPFSTASVAVNGTSATFDAGPEGKCKHRYWNIPIDRRAIVPNETIAELMAHELERLLAG
jgi:hypothetical protein